MEVEIRHIHARSEGAWLARSDRQGIHIVDLQDISRRQPDRGLDRPAVEQPYVAPARVAGGGQRQLGDAVRRRYLRRVAEQLPLSTAAREHQRDDEEEG